MDPKQDRFLVRVEPEQVGTLFDLLKANQAHSTVPMETTSLSDFRTGVFETSSYFWYRDFTDIYAFVHLTGFDAFARKAEFGVVALRRREGFATAACYSLFRLAFRGMGLNRLVAIVNADNEACMNLIRKEGALTHEGTLRRARFKDGTFIDQHVFSILAEETAKWDRKVRETAEVSA